METGPKYQPLQTGLMKNPGLLDEARSALKNQPLQAAFGEEPAYII